MNERKSNLVTVRMNDDDKELLDYLSDRLGRTMSDTIMRACKFFSNIAGNQRFDDVNTHEGGRKNHYIHMRVTDSELTFLNDSCNKFDWSISQLVRMAIKEYYKSMSGVY